MNFDIPIIFDDSPFFEWGDMRPSQDRRNFRSNARRHPKIFEEWGESDYYYDNPVQKQRYRGWPTERAYVNRRGMPKEEDRFEDDEGRQEDTSDTEEHWGVKGTPGDNFGSDGWDIPVQHVIVPKRIHHKHNQMPRHKHGKSHHDQSNSNDENIKSEKSTTHSDKANHHKEPPSDTETKTKTSNDEASEDQPKVSSGKKNMDQKSTDVLSNTETSSQAPEGDQNQSTEIPISYSPPKNSHRRHSKRLSQCEPPAISDIKLARIKSIVQRTEGLEEKIAEFNDSVQNKNYLYISETLMRILLDLDTVDSEGIDTVRSARKEGVRSVQALVDKLEAKLEENKGN